MPWGKILSPKLYECEHSICRRAPWVVSSLEKHDINAVYLNGSIFKIFWSTSAGSPWFFYHVCIVLWSPHLKCITWIIPWYTVSFIFPVTLRCIMSSKHLKHNLVFLVCFFKSRPMHRQFLFLDLVSINSYTIFKSPEFFTVFVYFDFPSLFQLVNLPLLTPCSFFSKVWTYSSFRAFSLLLWFMCFPPSVFQTKHHVRSQTEESCVCLRSYLVFLLQVQTMICTLQQFSWMWGYFGVHLITPYKGKS